jgi:hypothetical protein
MAKGTSRKRAKAANSRALEHLERRLAAFVVEQFPFASRPVIESLAGVFDVVCCSENLSEAIDSVRATVREKLSASISADAPEDTVETVPWVTAGERLDRAKRELVEAVDGFLRRESIAASFTVEERRELLRGMLLTRATDNQLKQLFLGGQVRHGKRAFQGKGFRSLGQEAIYAVPLRLRRGPDYRRDDGSWAVTSWPR